MPQKPNSERNKMKDLTKRLGFAGLVLVGGLALTNLGSYLIAKEDLTQHRSIEKAIKAHDKQFNIKGTPFDQIHSVVYGIGENIAYNQYSSKNSK